MLRADRFSTMDCRFRLRKCPGTPGPRRAGMFLLLLALLAFQNTPLAAREDDPDPNLAAKVKEIFRTRCAECHGGSATQGGINILDAESMVTAETVVPGKPDESQIYQAVVETEEFLRMPLGSPALSTEEIEAIRKWILAGAPRFPADVDRPKEDRPKSDASSRTGVEYVLQQILAHQRSLANDDRDYIRYFSSHHLLDGGATQVELDRQRDAFFLALNHLSRERQIIHPEVVNPDVGTIFALDLRKIGWHKPMFSTVSGSGEAAKHFNLFDLVLLEYPYGIISTYLESFEALAREYLQPSGMVRPIPYVRTDWFSSVATLPPLYHDLLQLPHTLEELERQLGVDPADNLHQRIAKRAGMAVSGVSRNNRAVERHPYAHGSYWKSFDYASSKGSDNIFANPVDLVASGMEMIFTLPNGLQGYYVADGAGERIDFAPTQIVTDKFAEDKTVRNGLSCMRCHDRGMKDFRDQVRFAVERIAGGGRIDKQATLALYPTHEQMSALVAEDQQRFLSAVERVIGHAPTEEPLTPVSKRFLEAPLQLSAVAGELGFISPDDLRVIVRQPQLTGLGLVALGDAGVVRRDMWEDHYDQVVRALGLGVPVVPLDGVSRPEYRPVTNELDVRLSTTRKSNIFAPGDELAIFVENHGPRTVFVELFGTSARGEATSILPAGAKVEPGKKIRFPETGTITVKSGLGRETMTLYASESEFPGAEILRASNIADRIVHPFYSLRTDKQRGLVPLDADKIIKRTLVIETR